MAPTLTVLAPGPRAWRPPNGDGVAGHGTPCTPPWPHVRGLPARHAPPATLHLGVMCCHPSFASSCMAPNGPHARPIATFSAQVERPYDAQVLQRRACSCAFRQFMAKSQVENPCNPRPHCPCCVGVEGVVQCVRVSKDLLCKKSSGSVVGGGHSAHPGLPNNTARRPFVSGTRQPMFRVQVVAEGRVVGVQVGGG